MDPAAPSRPEVRELQAVLGMELPDARLTVAQTRSVKASHGRYETRTLWAMASPALNAYVGSSGSQGTVWPGVAQVCRQQRVVSKRERKSGEWQTQAEVAYAITSLAPQRAKAPQLLVRWRGHWGIENGLHWVRDVTFGEDASPIYLGQAPELFALLRNCAIALLNVLDQPTLPAALREVTTTLAAFRKPFDRLSCVLRRPYANLPPHPT